VFRFCALPGRRGGWRRFGVWVDLRGRLARGLGVIPRGLIEDGAKAGDGEIPGCLTIASEGRETWAASSLRGVFAWALVFKAFSIEALASWFGLGFCLKRNA
jgi:hypothetical protein